MQVTLLNDKRRLWKYIIFGMLTFGIYDVIFMWQLISDLNVACKYVENDDDDRSPNYLVVVLLSLITFGIYTYFWYYKQGSRIRRAGKAYGLDIEEKGSTYLLWMTVGVLLFGFGPLVAVYLFIVNTNKICSMYNYKKNNELKKNSEYEAKYPISSIGAPLPYQSNEQLPTMGNYYGVNDDQPTIGKSSVGVIQCISGTYAGAEMEIKPNEELVIGRNSAICQLIFTDADISRKHCTIKYSYNDGNYYVIDHSTFGVVINDSQKLEKEVSTKCPVGTTLALGNGNNVFILK